MRHAGCGAFLAGLTLASGCFQEAAPRHDTPTDAASVSMDQQAVASNSSDAPAVEAIATVPQLAQQAQEEADPEARREALYLIADAGEAEDAAVIGQALYDPDEEVRLAAGEALPGSGAADPRGTGVRGKRGQVTVSFRGTASSASLDGSGRTRSAISLRAAMKSLPWLTASRAISSPPRR